MKKLFALGLICMSMLSSAWAVTSNNTTAPADQLAALLNHYQSLSANFTQTVTQKGKVIQKSSGKMELMRPGNFRWEAQGSNKQLLITNGDKLWVYDVDLAQVTIEHLQKAAGDSPAMLLTKPATDLQQSYNITKVSAPGNQQAFKLSSKTKSPAFRALTFYFTNQQINHMQIVDNIGQTTDLYFTNVQADPTLKSQDFTFTPPKGVDVIEEK